MVEYANNMKSNICLLKSSVCLLMYSYYGDVLQGGNTYLKMSL